MIKQSDIFLGSALNGYDKHALRKQKQQAKMKELLPNVKIQGKDKKSKKREVKEKDYIRTANDIFMMKYRVREFYVSHSIFTSVECWIDNRAIRKSAERIIDLLQEGDKVAVKNENGVVFEGTLQSILQKKKKDKIKLVVKDVRDNKVIVVNEEQFVSVLQLVERGNDNV
ncbi:MAG: hypothetical protein EOM50_07085 [Erysipelotrichia bacterium]|nr:hypothetical protein [Erysipelotrichia bacterium]NCC55020.1 hypothetical protein [Erysipelotrichia bacterium]